jgi:hypothetical protein
MRTVPFVKEPVSTGAATGEDYRVNLLERIQLKTRSHTAEASPEPEPPNPDGTEQANPEGPETKTEASATFDEAEPVDSDEQAAEKIEKLLVENPEELAELLVELGNVGRIIWGPGLYEGLMYPGQERNDIRDVVKKAIGNEKENKEATEGFNNYEKRLYDKWPKLQTSIQNISFTDEQIKKLAKYLGQDIARVGVPEFINNHRWILYWIGIELSKGKEIFQGRAGDMFAKKFGTG